MGRGKMEHWWWSPPQPWRLFNRRWWGHVFSPTTYTAHARHLVQRMGRGWSSHDAWSLDMHLTEIIIGGVDHIRRANHGYPMGIEPEEWSRILEEIVVGFEARRAMTDYEIMPNTPEWEQAEAKAERGFDLLKEWYGSLWI